MNTTSSSRIERWTLRFAVGAITVAALVSLNSAVAAALNGQVLGAGAPIASSTVTLWSASPGAPKQLAQARTGADGRFTLNAPATASKDASLYLTAKGGRSAVDKGGGDNPAIALMAAVGNKAPARVTISEMTTVASVWTHAQFIDGSAMSGHALGLKIAAGNVSNFVDVATGGGVRPFRIRSTAARRPRWRISPHWPMCWPDASLA